MTDSFRSAESFERLVKSPLDRLFDRLVEKEGKERDGSETELEGRINISMG